MSSVTDYFRTDVRDYVALDDKKEKAKEIIKKIDVKKKEIEENIIDFMTENRLQKKEIKISNSRLKCYTSKRTTPLNQKFIRESIIDYLIKEEDGVNRQQAENLGKQMVKFMYDPKKKMQACLMVMLGDPERAKDITDYVFSKRVKTEITMLRRKKQRVPVEVESGPISEYAEQAMRTPDETEESEYSD